MKKKFLLSIFLFASLALASAQSLLSTPHAYPGDMLSCVIYQGGEDDDIRFMLLDEQGQVKSDAPGIPFDLEEEEGDHYIGLMGLSSELKPGRYKLKAEIRNSRGVSLFDRPVLLRSKDFKTEDIPLNQSMSNLRTEDSALKRDQARKLWALLNKMSPGRVSPAGVMLSPVDEFIQTSWYGDRRTYVYSDGGTARSLHNGMDLAASTGTEVYTPLEGRVVMAEERVITGYTVVLEHFPGVYTLYYHLDRIEAELDQWLSQGEILGVVGSTGLVTGPHLHWELRVNTIPVDPERYLSLPLIDKDGILAIINDTKEQGR